MNQAATRSILATLFILLGILLFVGQIMEVDIPVFRIIISFVIIGLGIQLIQRAGKSAPSNSNITSHGSYNTVFLGSGELNVDFDNLKNRYQVILGNQVLNFKHFTLKEERSVEIFTILGESRIFLPEGLNYKIHASTFLGETKGPQGKHSSGDVTLEGNSFDKDQPALIIKTSTLLGEIKISEI